MAKEGKIEGKNILITGGASGLGALYAEAFLKHGAQNVAILDIAEEVGKNYAEKLNETYKDRVIFVKCDVSKEEEISNSFQTVVNAFKKIDVIINNAGVMNDSMEIWRTACDVNWQGVVSFTRKGIEHMRTDEGGQGGTIVNVSSAVAVVRVLHLAVYCGSKAAVLHFSRSLATPEFYDATGVRILTICFGPTDTPLLSNLPSRFFDLKFVKLFFEKSPNAPFQSVEAAVEALLKMFREGSPGSVWISQNNEPGEDVTSIVNEAFKPLETLLTPKGQ